MKKTNNIIIQSLIGLAYGYFISFVLGTILIVFGDFIHLEVLSSLGNYLQSLSGVAIAIAIGIAVEAKGLNMLCLLLSGGIVSYMSSYLILIYLVVLLTIVMMQNIKTKMDIWLKPLLVIIISFMISYLLNPYINTFMTYLGIYFNTMMNSESLLLKVITSIMIAVVMGLFISAPVGGVTICSLMNFNSVVCGIALCGICSYTIGLAIMLWHDNHIGDILAIFVGTPLLAFTNIIKKPLILIPLILSSSVSGALTGCVFFIKASQEAGYGLMVFQGIVDAINYNGFVYMPAILLINIAVPAIMCTCIYFIFYRFHFIKHGDLKMEHL